ncbi:MAG: DUF924 domain-containing protein [Leptolyngbya sp. SIOISBB]|nr:DUF924 domain-containing protein [Leptolyngbya sp. SIOISBB]
MPEAQAILTFWFDDPAIPNSEYGRQRKIWFRKDPSFDQQVRDRFLSIYEQARQGTFAPWIEQPRSALALTILLDQFPRNMFRGTAHCFEADSQALATAQAAIAHQHDHALIPVERMFLYLPFEHSENIEHQRQAVSLFEALARSAPELQSTLDYAYRHRDVIAQFGRFPHRNESLGRESTEAEILFLKQPGARF